VRDSDVVQAAYLGSDDIEMEIEAAVHGRHGLTQISGGTLLEIHNLTVANGDTIVLRDVSISVRIRRSSRCSGHGAGKTTTLRMAAGLARPNRARSRSAARTSPAQPVRAVAAWSCLIPEGRGIFPSLTVRENLTLYVPKGQEREAYERRSTPSRARSAEEPDRRHPQRRWSSRCWPSCAPTSPIRTRLVDEASLGTGTARRQRHLPVH